MLNQTIIVGRLTNDLEVRETESGKKVSSLTLAVPRFFKNADGEYDTWNFEEEDLEEDYYYEDD